MRVGFGGFLPTFVLYCLWFCLLFLLDSDFPLLAASIGFSESLSGFGFNVSSGNSARHFLP